MSQRKKGFTLIEVSLVFGLAAAIFLMAFIALPSLWISQRDAKRKANVMELASDIKIYQTNNSRGALPTITGSSGKEGFTLKEAKENPNTEWRSFVKNYVAKDFADPNTAEDGSDLSFRISICKPNSSVTGDTLTCAERETNTVVSPNFNKTIYIFIGATCDGDHAAKTSSERKVAVTQALERGGRYCHST